MFYQQYISQAMVAQASGDVGEAEGFFKEALAEAESVDPEGPRVAEACNYLGAFYQKNGRPDQAIVMIERAMAVYERRMQGEGDEMKNFYTMLAALYEEAGDGETSESWKQKARQVGGHA